MSRQSVRDLGSSPRFDPRTKTTLPVFGTLLEWIREEKSGLAWPVGTAIRLQDGVPSCQFVGVCQTQAREQNALLMFTDAQTS